MLKKQGSCRSEAFGFGKTVIAIAVAGIALQASAASAEDFVAMLLPENVNPRWESQDAFFFVEAMKEVAPDVTVEVFNANNDTATQQRQAEQALTRGAKVLVVIPIDGESSAIIADDAAAAGVPTIAYDRMIHSENTSFWVQADLGAMGASQAEHVVENTKDGDTLVLLKGSPTDPNAAVIHNGQLEILQPLFDSGERILGYENWTQGWDPAIARRSMDQALTKLDNNVQGVVSSNDGNAGAAIASLAEQGMAGKVPVSGLDCTVQALQLILLGEQTQSGWRPFNDMATVTANVTARLVKGEGVDDLIQGTVKNAADADVPFVPVDHYSAVGEEGVAYVIENDTSISKEDVCQGKAAETAFCS
ncbi:MAG: ABC transporter substrate-binding protein [Geminicoccaceae bacterium]